jgi:ribosomal protein S18 acetylase RimI-like enzyme
MTMKKENVAYKIGQATVNDVYVHLLACSDNFIPPLSGRINIREYAEKIVNNAVTFEVWQDDQLAGLVAAYVNDPAGKTAFITNVSVIKTLMGTGAASTLLENLVEYAAGKNFSEISLEVHKENYPAIQFYSKLSFSKEFEKDQSLIMKKKIAAA